MEQLEVMLRQAKEGHIKTFAFIYELDDSGAANGYLGLSNTEKLLQYMGLLEVTKVLMLEDYMNATEDHDGPPPEES